MFPMKLRGLIDAEASSPTPAAQVSPSIVIIIIVLTIIFFLSAFLHLLIRWLARNPALIRRGLRPGAQAGSNNRIITLTALQGQLQQLFSLQDGGLERSLIEELPVFSYKAAMDGLKEGADCAICLCEFVGDDQLRLLPLCGHAFHTECIDAWLFAHSTCPLCRTLLLPECWIPGTLQPLLSSEISTAGEADHLPLAEAAVPALSGRFNGLGASSRRSSLGPVTVIAGNTLVDHNHTQLAAELQLIQVSPLNLVDNRTESPISENPDIANPASIASRGLANSARLASSDAERSQSFTKIGSMYASRESMDCANHTINKDANEGTSSAIGKSFICTNSASAAIVDSGRLSYTSLGAQSETFNEIDRASAYGSGRRVAVHLGKCRLVGEEAGKSTQIPKARRGASRRSYSKGPYEYVIDSSSNLEMLMPPSSKPTAFVSGSRLHELLNWGSRISSSSVDITSNAAHEPRDSVSKSMSPSWASASFRKLRLWSGGDVDMSVDAMNAPLNTSRPSDKPVQLGAMGDCLQVVAIMPERAESSGTTSMRANVGSDVSFSPEVVSHRLMMGSGDVTAANLEPAKHGAVSFRLPMPSSHDVLRARLEASASRRTLSESEAFSYWEPTITEQCEDHPFDDQRFLVVDDNTGSHRSSSFARRTVDWLVGWQKRMVHPDKSAQAGVY